MESDHSQHIRLTPFSCHESPSPTAQGKHTVPARVARDLQGHLVQVQSYKLQIENPQPHQTLSSLSFRSFVHTEGKALTRVRSWFSRRQALQGRIFLRTIGGVFCLFFRAERRMYFLLVKEKGEDEKEGLRGFLAVRWVVLVCFLPLLQTYEVGAV